MRREGIHVTADGFDGVGNVSRGAPVRPLEQQVLEEMAGARQLVGLVS